MPAVQRSFGHLMLRPLARLAAWFLSRHRNLVHIRLSVYECERKEVPEGTFEAAPVVDVYDEVRRGWRFGCWLDTDTDNPEGCLHLDLFRASANIFYYRKGQNYATSQAYVDARCQAHDAALEAALES